MEQDRDSEYIERVKNGDTEVFGYLVSRYSARIFSLTAGICASREDAEEVTQDAFVKAFLNIHKYNHRSGFMTWLYRIAYNTAISHLRKNRKGVVVPTDSEHLPGDATADEGNDALSKERRLSILEQAVSRLEPPERTLLLLFYKDNMPLSGIASVMDISEENAKTRLHRIRKKTGNIYRKIEDDDN